MVNTHAHASSPLRDLGIVVGVLVLAAWGFVNFGGFALSHCNDDAQSGRPGAAACTTLLAGAGQLVMLVPAALFIAVVLLTRDRAGRFGVRLRSFLALVALPVALNALLGTFSS